MNDGVKTIGVLTSGGDAPGMNAAVRAGRQNGDCLRLSGQGDSEGIFRTAGGRDH